MENEKTELLLVNESYEPVITEHEARELKPILQSFVKAYVQNSRKDIKEWLPQKVQESLPGTTTEEAEKIVNEVELSLKAAEESRVSLIDAKKAGKTREAWMSEQFKKAASNMAQEQAVRYLTGLDEALVRSNEAMHQTITTTAGTVSQNPHLDGFIAERQHVETFNLNAQAKGSQYRAEVLEPGPGERYGKNSVDIVIKDSGGRIVRRYQSKYCKDAAATEQAFEHGDYRGQQKLIPEGQEIQGKSTTVIEAPDGTKSEPLSKEDAQQLQEKAQKGEVKEFDWNNYSTEDLAKQAGAQAGFACLQGAAIGMGFDIARKVWEGEPIDAEEEIDLALKTGTDFGIKSAVGSALKVGSEKGILQFIPKGTPASVLASVAFVGVENAKVLSKVAAGDLTPREGVEKMADVTASSLGGLVAMGDGTVIGTNTGTVLGVALGSALGGPAGAIVGGKIGAAVGGFVGGSIGYMAGSKVGQAVCNAAKKVVNVAVNTVKTVGKTVVETGKAIVNAGKKLLNFLFG